MTQRRERWTAPSDHIASRVRALRNRRGWSAERLAQACADVGMPQLNRSVIANIESRRRGQLTVEEFLTLAYLLDVAPVHLLVPTEVDESVDVERYMATPDRFLSVPQARAWIRGDWCPPGCDPRTYFAEVPADEFRPGRPTPETITRRGAALDPERKVDDLVFGGYETWEQEQGQSPDRPDQQVDPGDS